MLVSGFCPFSGRFTRLYLSSVRCQVPRGASALSVRCARHGHSAGLPLGSLSSRPIHHPVTEAPPSSRFADEELKLRQAETLQLSQAARGLAPIVSLGAGCPTPFSWALSSWWPSSWVTLLSRLCRLECGCWAPGADGCGCPLLTTCPPWSWSCLPRCSGTWAQSLRPICSAFTALLLPCLPLS